MRTRTGFGGLAIKHLSLACLLLPAAYFAVGLDNWAGDSFKFGFEACFISVGILAVSLVVLLGEQRALLLLPFAYILFILALPFLDFSPVKPAIRAVREIRTGMTESQVRAVLDRHFPEHGRFKRPAIGALQGDILSLVLDPHDGRYNAAIVQIRFSGGKCVSAEFLPD